MKDSYPQLKIDWGTDIRADMHLTPEFFLAGLPHDEPPVVYFPPDARMNREHWQTFPPVKKRNGAFCFDQKMIFDRAGKFVLDVYVIQTVPGGQDPLCWRGTLRVAVSRDPASRSVTIEAETFAGANLGELDGNITIKAGNVVADFTNDRDFNRALGESLAGRRDKPDETAKPSHVSHLELEPAGEEVVRLCPYVSPPQELACRALTLVHPNGFRTRIVADRAFRLGRNCSSPGEAVVNDVELSLTPPEGADDATREDLLHVAGLFSRAHAIIALDENGLWLHDTRGKGVSQGLLLDGELISREKSRRLDAKSRKTHLLSFAHLLELDMELNADDFPEKSPLPMPRADVEAGILAIYLRRFSLAPADFRRSRLAGVSSVTLHHRAHHGTLNSGGRQAERTAYLCEKMRYALLGRGKDTAWVAAWEKRFRQWLSRPQANPRAERENYLLLLTHATLGGSTAATLRFTGRGAHAWSNTLLRLWNFDRSLYLECFESDSPVYVLLPDQPETLLRPFRPIPITAGMTVRCGDAEFMFCEE